MKQKKLKALASKIWDLEKKCQNGENVSENMHEMTKLCSSLSVDELLLLDETIAELKLKS